MKRIDRSNILVTGAVALVLTTSFVAAQETSSQGLDDRVKTFLDEHEYAWRDMNIPAKDGRFMYDLIVEKGYTRGLEIGTSTGHSAIWIAWAMSKTGGKLITIEIDEGRYKQAIRNFREAGVAEYVDARLADAHGLVKELGGPFDFVFSDADKEWYTQYFKDVAPKMVAGGCFIAHNISMRSPGIREFVDYMKTREDFETTIEREKTSGVSVSTKKDIAKTR